MLSHLLSRPAVATRSRRQLIIGAAGAAAAILDLQRTALAAAMTGGKPLVAATFDPFVGQDFLLSKGGETQAALRLLQVVQLPRGTRSSSLPNPFSLIFWSPWNRIVASDTYAVILPDHKSIPMFITPVSANAYHYEAPFN